MQNTNPIHALREVRISQVGVLIEQIRKTNPKLLEDIPGDKAAALIRKVFKQMNQTLAMTEEGVVKFVGLGQFRVRKVEKELEGKKVTRTQIVFTRSEQ
jgi:nucleoid DNA-binding protein